MLEYICKLHNIEVSKQENKERSKMTKQKALTYITYLFNKSEHFGDFDYCYELASDSWNYMYDYHQKDLKELRKFFLDYTLNVWGYRLEEFV